jgi:hypothetical protein
MKDVIGGKRAKKRLFSFASLFKRTPEAHGMPVNAYLLRRKDGVLLLDTRYSAFTI